MAVAQNLFISYIRVRGRGVGLWFLGGTMESMNKVDYNVLFFSFSIIFIK